MRTRTLGDLEVSVIGLGCNNFGRRGFVTEGIEGTREVLGACLDHGITLLDTAALYGGPESVSEQLIGQALVGRRDQIVLATKFGHTDGPEPADWGRRGSAEFIRRACDASLQRLRTDRIDLYQMHEPDPETPIEETIGVLAELHDAGKILAYGHSNFDAGQAREAAATAVELGDPPFVSAQNLYSLLERDIEAELIPALRDLGLGLLPFFPLRDGLLTGKYRKGQAAPAGSRLSHIGKRFDNITDEQWDAIEAYRVVCDDLGLPMAQVTFAWMLAQDVVSSVIAGATSREQVAQNAAAADIDLPTDAVERISEIFPHPAR